MLLCDQPVAFVKAILDLFTEDRHLRTEQFECSDGHPVFSVEDVFPLLFNSNKLEIILKILSVFMLDRLNANPYIYVLIDCWLG